MCIARCVRVYVCMCIHCCVWVAPHHRCVQDIAGWSFAFGESHYMLVGPAGWTNGSSELLTPHPDYYTTILFRQLIGRHIFNTTGV